MNEAPAYVSVVTYRPDGTGTACPVYAAGSGNRIYFRTFARTLKVRRLTATSRVLVAPCERDGAVIGAYLAGSARRLDGRAACEAQWQLTRRHGVRKIVADLLCRPRLGSARTYVIEIAGQ